MRPVPECLQRRYQVMDALINDLSSESSGHIGIGNSGAQDDYGIKLMCKFWNILKENPNADLQSVVHKCVPLNTKDSGIFGSQHIPCYQINKHDSKPEKIKFSNLNGRKELQVETTTPDNLMEEPRPPLDNTYGCSCPEGPSNCISKKTRLNPSSDPNSYEHIDWDKKCKDTRNGRANCQKTAELMSVRKKLNEEIAQLEKREEEEMKLMKEADEMWKKMESEYKNKLSASTQKQADLLVQLKEVETSAAKWKKNKKDLEEQMMSVEKGINQIRSKYLKKTNDIKIIAAEIADLEKRIENITKEKSQLSKTLETKRKSFDKHMGKLIEDRKKLQLDKKHEENLKNEKIDQGNEYVKEAREELAKLCKILLKKKLENENLRVEANALAKDIDSLEGACVECDEKSKVKEQNLKSKITKCQYEIDNLKLKCTKCHVSCDTMILKKYCTDCPRCQKESESCVVSGNKCSEYKECVCVNVKAKFMSNVFENMQTVLERQINTKPGKAVANQVLQCLRLSTNGKLDRDTRKKLQEFVLATVKTNLNLTIIGGAVKTRCEMNPDTYQQLMKCLKQIKTTTIEKKNKATDSRKDPCARWGGTQECNCPRGPQNCLCKRKAPKPPSDPSPSVQLDEDKQDIGELSICPHKDKTPCGPLCETVPTPDVAKDATRSWKPAPCRGEDCIFNKNMRAAQCDLLEDSNNMIGAEETQERKNAPAMQRMCNCGYSACDCYESLLQRNEVIEDVIHYNE